MSARPTGMRRAFLAVVPPPAVLRWTDAAVDSARALGDGLRWTRTGQRHLTVQFLGPVGEPARLVESVSESVRRVPPFTLGLGGGGAFPNARRASVVWIGVREGSEAMRELAAAVASAPREPDDRPFHPHLTLARVNRARDLRVLVTALDALAPSPTWTVDDVVLFESTTHADGAVHTEQARFMLAGDAHAPA